jgi:hypothetical protein
METLRRPGVFTGLCVSAMVTAALLGILYFGWRVAGLPFVPFDMFDWLTRVLPGRVIAFGIGSMVTMIRALNLGPTAATAKNLGHLEIRLAVSVGQTHFYRAVLRGKRYAADRYAQSGRAGRSHGTVHQVNDAVTKALPKIPGTSANANRHLQQALARVVS